MTLGTACGKIILFGEHAVVYGRPALAVPLSKLRARAVVEGRNEAGSVIHARDLGSDIWLNTASADEPLAAVTRLALKRLDAWGNLDISVESDIPIAAGFGSGAAISTAIVRGLAAHFGQNLTPADVSALVYETEKMYHGTPSGIDNTVIAYEQPIRFVRRNSAREGKVGQKEPGQAASPKRVSGEDTAGLEVEMFRIARPFTLAIANTGIASPTKITVGDVRRAWEQNRLRYKEIFDTVAAIVVEAQTAIESGENDKLGELMTRNQQELRAIGVSSPEIERLIGAGLEAGAEGGKLSGGGRGGNVIFYVQESRGAEVRRALLEAGAVSVIVVVIGE